jgi:hypothetical protein
MHDLSSVVESLRRVQQARRRFLEMWKVEKDYINPMLDRMAEDLQAIMTTPNGADDDPFGAAERDRDRDRDRERERDRERDTTI